MGQWPLKWTPNGPHNCSWFIWVHFLTFWSITALIYDKNTNYLNMWKLAVFGVLTLAASTDQTGPFSYDLVIFHTRPHVGWVWKIEKPWKKCIVWSVEVAKVTCIFLQNFWLKILKASETSKNHSGGPKNPEIIQKLSIFHFPNWRDHRKTCFSAPKGAISAKSTKSEKGVRLCNTACMGLPWKI